MNVTVVSIALTLTLALTAAMWCVFRYSKDTYQYQEHYCENGFSAELPEDRQLPQDSAWPPVVTPTRVDSNHNR